MTDRHLPHPGTPRELVDYVAELTRWHVVETSYDTRHNGTTWSRRHRVKAPPLLEQLAHATPSARGDQLGAGGYRSRPVARIEALDALARIGREAARWVRDLGQDDPGSTIGCVRRLGALAASLDAATVDQVEHAVRGWWISARIVSGWDSSAWRPHNTCPVCDELGSLRVRLADMVGLCAHCGETWGPWSIGLLAEHIRGENAEDT